MTSCPPGGTRLPSLAPESLTPAQRSLYEEIVGGPRKSPVDAAGHLRGPFNVMLYAPAVGSALQSLGAALRYRGLLAERIRELVILFVAAHLQCDYEWQAHQHLAQASGVTDAELQTLRTGDVDSWSAADAAILRSVKSLLTKSDLEDAEYEQVAGQISQGEIVELATLVGYYSLLASLIQLFRVT
jgi:4-carboxymuconolactone decarboxylase